MTPSETISELVRLYPTLPPGSMLWRLADYLQWVGSGGCIIRDVHGELIRLRLNAVQARIMATMIRQAMAGRPIRLVILKARKPGVTTLIETLFVRLCQRNRNQAARVLAHKAEATQDIFEIARRASRQVPAEPKRREIEFACQSLYACYTAGGAGVGAGGTPSLLHLSEVGLWPGVMTDDKAKETEYTSIEAVPYVPETIIVYESTARGRNLMWKRFSDARDGATRYAAIFVPWFADARNTLESETLIRTHDERLIVDLARTDGIEISDGMLAWRRDRIRELGANLFKQEHPATPEEAVESWKGLILPGLSMHIIDTLPFEYKTLDWSDRVGGMDYGYHDPTVLLSAAYVDQVLYVVKVHRASQQLARDHIAGLAEGHTYYCDPSATGGMQELQAAIGDALKGREQQHGSPRGVRIVAAPRGRGATGTGIVKDEWEYVARLMRLGRLKVLRGAHEQLMVEADSLAWNPQTGEPDMTRGETWGHYDTLCALRYCTMGMRRHEGSGVVVARGERRSLKRSLVSAKRADDFDWS